MTNNSQLSEILSAQIQLSEALLALVLQQQQAIIHSNEEEILRLTHRQQELLQPLSALENERTIIVKSHTANKEERALEEHLRTVVRRIVEINKQNKILIDNSLRFVRQTLRILTNDYQRNLVDTRA